MSKTGYIVDAAGNIQGRIIVTNDEDLPYNIPADCVFVESAVAPPSATVVTNPDGTFSITGDV